MTAFFPLLPLLCCLLAWASTPVSERERVVGLVPEADLRAGTAAPPLDDDPPASPPDLGWRRLGEGPFGAALPEARGPPGSSPDRGPGSMLHGGSRVVWVDSQHPLTIGNRSSPERAAGANLPHRARDPRTPGGSSFLGPASPTRTGFERQPCVGLTTPRSGRIACASGLNGG